MEYFLVRYNSRVVIYEHKMLIRLTTDLGGTDAAASGQSYKASMLVNYDSRVVSIRNLLVIMTN